jgi:peptidyl-prolyl cis-trans isomerase D
MISWIQRTFQQHFKWLFFALLAVVIVSFVFMTNAGPSQGERRQPPRPFFDIDLSQAEDQRRLAEDAQLSIFLRFNPGREIPQNQVSQYALNRHAALVLADRLGLPAPTEEALVAHIRTLRAFAGPDGNFDPKRYAEFTDSIRLNPRLTEGDVSRVISDDARLVAYETLLAGPGYVLPSDVAEMIAGRDTVWTLVIGSIDGSAFAPRIDTTDTALAAWFETNSRRYEIAPRTSVATLRLQAETEKAALDSAADLAVRLLEENVKPADLPAFLPKAPGVTLVEIGALAPDAIPAELGGPSARTVATEASRLSADRPYSNPVAVPGGAAVLVWREDIPARVPELSEVRARVLADYQVAEKRRLFNAAGRELQTKVAAAVASGKPFAEALASAASAAGLKVEIKTPAPFSLSGEFPADMDFTVLQSLDRLSLGKVGDFIPAGENSGRIVYAAGQKLPVIDPTSADYVAIRKELAESLSRANAAALLDAVVDAELAKTAPVTD